MDRQINYSFEEDKSVSFFQPLLELGEEYSNGPDGQFIRDILEKQYLQYYQILDTDYDNFMTVYNCQEHAEYRDKKTGQYLSDQEVWDNVKD